MTILKDDLAEWRLHPVSIELTQLMHEELDRIKQSMADGHYLNLEGMHETFGAMSKAVGEIEGLNHYFNIIEGETDEN